MTEEAIPWTRVTAAPRPSKRRRYWNLLREVTIAQTRLKDQNTFFGFLWSFLHPLLILAVLFAFFHNRVGKGIDHYVIYLLLAIIHFTHFSGSTSGAMTTLINMRQLTCNTILPKEVLVIGAVLSKLPEFAISMVICVVIALATGVKPVAGMALLPLIVLLQVLVTMWVALVLSVVYVFVKDAGYVYQVFLRVLFLITPTFYSMDFVGKGARWVMLLNPLAQLINLSRSAILGHGVPLRLLGGLVVVNALLIVLALNFFRRMEPQFAEHV
jgi:ABC-type polysaccharide/polyol phosphate export permease